MHATVQFHFFDGYPGAFVTPAGATLFGFDEYNSFDQIKDSRAAVPECRLRAVAPTVTLRAGRALHQGQVTVRNFYALEGGLTARSVGSPLH